MISQQDELDNENNQQQQQQDGRNGELAVISQENRPQTNNNNQQRLRMKWTKEFNKDIIRCYFNTILRIPNQPYRKEFYDRWVRLHPENPLTEQRICDQQRIVMRKVNTRENTRGSWLTQIEIEQIQNLITHQINDEINNHTNEPENAVQQINIPTADNNVEENATHTQEIQPNNQPDGDEASQIKETLADKYAEAITTPMDKRSDLKKPNKGALKSLEKSLTKVNKALETFPLLTEISDVNQLNNMVYAAALTAIETAGIQRECISTKRQQQKRNNDWTFNMKRRIDDLRGDISRISQMSLSNPSTKIKKNNNAMRNKYKINDEEKRLTTHETLKQRLHALNNRLVRYQKRQTQFRQNRDFANKPSKLYDELRGNRINVKEPPTKESVEQFWKPLYQNRKTYNHQAEWRQQYSESLDIEEATYSSITSNEISKSTSNFSNWKSPGIDKLQNFWWNRLTNLHPKIAQIFDSILIDPTKSPEWLTTGRTTLIPKKEPTNNPSNYRPITCLPVIYKILSSIITSRFNHHIEANQIIPPEQKGNASNTFGTIDQLMINKMILESAIKRKVNISTAWIDYKKAYDSVPHDWIIESLKVHKFDNTIINFIESTMKNWSTSLTLSHSNGQLTTDKFSINTGIFQGDCTSGLLFILSLLPLSWLLKRSNLGFRMSSEQNRTISHLLFMDDLKLYATNDNQLANMIDIVQSFSNDIKMDFGIDKCNKLTIKRGKVVPSENIDLDNGEQLKSLETNQNYRYLGFNERHTTDKNTKTTIQQEYFSRIKMILKSELSSKNTVDAINSYAVPALSYGFPVLDWNITELEKVDRETRKVIQNHHLMHRQSDITRLYIPRKNGGRGLINIVDHFKNAIINFSIYLLNSNERLLDLASNWQFSRGAKSIHNMAQSYCQELQLEIQELTQNNKQQRKSKLKKFRLDKLVNELKNKNLHGQYLKLLDEAHIDKTASLKWLTSPSLKRATEATICAIQEQAITTNYIRKHIFKTENCDLCRVCRAGKETIHHIISGCVALAPTKYLQRHDNVCKYIHATLLEGHGFTNVLPKWYEHQPRCVEENESTKILWNFSIQTDHTILHNKPDIVIIDKVKNEATIIDVAIPNDQNLARKRLDKLRAYTDLAVEIKTLWNLTNVTIVPMIIGAMGSFHNGFQLEIEKIPLGGKTLQQYEMQKITLLGTAHIVRSFLQIA